MPEPIYDAIVLGLGAMAVIAKPFQLAEVAQLVWEQAACKT